MRRVAPRVSLLDGCIAVKWCGGLLIHNNTFAYRFQYVYKLGATKRRTEAPEATLGGSGIRIVRIQLPSSATTSEKQNGGWKELGSLSSKKRLAAPTKPKKQSQEKSGGNGGRMKDESSRFGALGDSFLASAPSAHRGIIRAKALLVFYLRRLGYRTSSISHNFVDVEDSHTKAKYMDWHFLWASMEKVVKQTAAPRTKVVFDTSKELDATSTPDVWQERKAASNDGKERDAVVCSPERPGDAEVEEEEKAVVGIGRTLSEAVRKALRHAELLDRSPALAEIRENGSTDRRIRILMHHSFSTHRKRVPPPAWVFQKDVQNDESSLPDGEEQESFSCASGKENSRLASAYMSDAASVPRFNDITEDASATNDAAEPFPLPEEVENATQNQLNSEVMSGFFSLPSALREKIKRFVTFLLHCSSTSRPLPPLCLFQIGELVQATEPQTKIAIAAARIIECLSREEVKKLSTAALATRIHGRLLQSRATRVTVSNMNDMLEGNSSGSRKKKRKKTKRYQKAYFSAMASFQWQEQAWRAFATADGYKGAHQRARALALLMLYLSVNEFFSDVVETGALQLPTASTNPAKRGFNPIQETDFNVVNAAESEESLALKGHQLPKLALLPTNAKTASHQQIRKKQKKQRRQERKKQLIQKAKKATKGEGKKKKKREKRKKQQQMKRLHQEQRDTNAAAQPSTFPKKSEFSLSSLISMFPLKTRQLLVCYHALISPIQLEVSQIGLTSFVATCLMGGVTLEERGVSDLEAAFGALQSTLDVLSSMESTVEPTFLHSAEEPRSSIVDEDATRFLALQRLMRQYPQIELGPLIAAPKARFTLSLEPATAQKIDQVASRYLSNEEVLKAIDDASSNITPQHDSEDREELNSRDSSCHRACFARQTSFNTSEKMRQRLRAQRDSEAYRLKFAPMRERLSICTAREEIIETLETSRVVIVCGTTGCGKSTQVPQYILDYEIERGRGLACSMLMTQPRRLSAVSIAERIAAERGSHVGEEIGYAIRLSAKWGSHLTVCTAGVVLQRFVHGDPLRDVSHLIIDEIHERDTHNDFVLALCKRELMRNRSLRVVLMSATMDAERFGQYFDGAKVIHIEGRRFDVEERFLDDIPKLRGFYAKDAPTLYALNKLARIETNSQPLHSFYPLDSLDYGLIAATLSCSIRRNEMRKGKDAALIFLPGWRELLHAQRAIENMAHRRSLTIRTVLVHSSLTQAQQRKCFQAAPKEGYKVVLATNIAESGVTIDDVTVVIDTATIKVSCWAPRREVASKGSPMGDASLGGTAHDDAGEEPMEGKLPSLEVTYAQMLGTQFASRANLTQRKGRAGRVRAGVCYRLIPRALYNALPPFLPPEVQRASLDSTVASMIAIGFHNPGELLDDFLDPPSHVSVARAVASLQNIGAVATTTTSGEEKRLYLTPLGRVLSSLPAPPRIAKLILMGAVFGCLDTALTMAAAAEVSPFLRSATARGPTTRGRRVLAMHTNSDHLADVNAFNMMQATEQDHATAVFLGIDHNAIRLLSQYKRQFAQILREAAAGLLPQRSACDAVDGDATAVAEEGNEDGNGGATGRRLFSLVDGNASWSCTNVALARGCVASVLYPNVALATARTFEYLCLNDLEQSCFEGAARKKTSKARRRKRDAAATPPISFRTKLERQLKPGSASVLGLRANYTRAALAVYNQLFSVTDRGRETLDTLTEVSVWEVVLFAAPIARLTHVPSLSLLLIEGWLCVHCPSDVFQRVLRMKRLMEATMIHAVRWRRAARSTETSDAGRRSEDPQRLWVAREMRRDVSALCASVLEPLDAASPEPWWGKSRSSREGGKGQQREHPLEEQEAMATILHPTKTKKHRALKVLREEELKEREEREKTYKA